MKLPEFGIAHLAVVPIRFEPSDRSEQVSQLLFGETIEILESDGNWDRVKCSWDGYEGWIDRKQYQIILHDSFHSYNPTFPQVCLDFLNPAQIGDQPLNLPIGSTLPRFDGNHFYINESTYTFFGKSILAGNTMLTTRLEELAFLFLNSPYQWGGRSPFGIDCSGFTQVVYKLLGKKLKRDAFQQAEQGATVDFFEEAKLGDLAFFDNEEEQIIHVGIVLTEGRIIHASGKVRVDKLDHQGIFNVENKKYSHKLRIIKRLL